MRRMVRHVMVFALALALVASTAAWRQCAALHGTAADAAKTEHVAHAAHHHADAAGHGESDRHAMHHQHAADDPAPPAADDHGSMKCCAMCTVASAAVAATAITVTLTVSAHIFLGSQDLRSGNLIAVDPGIPKRIG